MIDNKHASSVQQYGDGIGILLDTMYDQTYSVPKASCPLWMFARMEGNERKLDNITTIYALILDYDGGVTPVQFHNQYRHLEYYWYASVNHLVDGATHKFKVVLPLQEEIPFSEIYTPQGQAALVAYFEGIDPTSMRNYQARPNRGPNYVCGYNIADTVRYSLDMVKETIASRPDIQRLPARRASKDVRGYYNPEPLEYINRIRKYQYQQLLALPQSAGEQSYHHYCSLVARMLASNCNGVWCWSYDEVYQIVVGHRNDKAMQQLVINFGANRQQFPPDATKPTTKAFANLGAY
jgi:hypothetical protein